MDNILLAFWGPGPIELIVILVMGLIIFGIPIALTVLIIICFVNSNKERQRLRKEVKKLSEEVDRLKQEKP